jgi:hypothetical protein
MIFDEVMNNYFKMQKMILKEARGICFCRLSLPKIVN